MEKEENQRSGQPNKDANHSTKPFTMPKTHEKCTQKIEVLKETQIDRVGVIHAQLNKVTHHKVLAEIVEEAWMTATTKRKTTR